MGVKWSRLNGSGRFARSGSLVVHFKNAEQNINAEDSNIEALLAQAEYIKDRADEFVTEIGRAHV